MLGADEATIEGIKPELHAMSAPNRLFNCGPLGSASVIKMYVKSTQTNRGDV